MITVAVTGVNGFVGRHLTRELVDAGHRVVGIGREAEAAEKSLLDDYLAVDLAEGWPSLPPVGSVVHLAGLSAVGPSFDEPRRYLEENGAMVVNLFEAMRSSPATRVMIVSSGAVYDSEQAQPLTEGSAIGFSSPYVVSKVLVENLTSYYLGRGVDALVVRPFNHIGPGQREGFLVPDLVSTMRHAELTGGVPAFGNLSTLRDYTDVRDVVRAYRMLLEAQTLTDRVFNVCSGVSLSGHRILELVAEALGVSVAAPEVDPQRVRPQDPSTVTGSHHRLTRAVGWNPHIDPGSSIRDYVTSM